MLFFYSFRFLAKTLPPGHFQVRGIYYHESMTMTNARAHPGA